MLVLSRRQSESIYLDIPPSTEPRRVEVCVVRFGSTSVKLGFNADIDITIARGELVESQQQDAA